MEPVLGPLRNRLRRRLAPVREWLNKISEMLAPRVAEARLQRMCPFCGLITLRRKTSCLECGKTLKPT